MLRHGNTKPIWNNTEIEYLDVRLEIRYKSEERLHNIKGIRCNSPNVLSRVLTVKDMLQPVIKCVVIPERGLEDLIAKLLDRTYIFYNNSCRLAAGRGGDGGGRRGGQGATTYHQATGSGRPLQRPSCGGETNNCLRGDWNLVLACSQQQRAVKSS